MFTLSFRFIHAHISDIVKCRFFEKNTNLAIISGGLTSKVQLLDIAINKSFKAR
ncbi:15972_t:CDS:1, partial [Dentiscutata erythropus]